MTAPSLLFVSPVIPNDTGNGLAMRGAMMLRALAGVYRVSLHIVPLYASPVAATPPEISALCERVTTGWPGPTPVHDRRRWRRARRYDVVHIFRLATLPHAYRLHGTEGAVWDLDLDDIESRTRARLADLALLRGENGLAEQERIGSLQARVSEEVTLVRMRRVYVCSETDRTALVSRGIASARVVPNAVSTLSLDRREPSAPFVFLFVGTLGYLPNVDAVEWFCTQVVPHIRRKATIAFRVDVVGGGDTSSLAAVAALPDVRLVGAVPDVGPYYAGAGAALNPVRAGGGTRIKVLEAFAHGCPVVSTTVGAEGIAAQSGTHLLIADEPEAFADACVRLMTDEALRRHLIEQAHGLVTREYSRDVVARIVASFGP